MLKRALLAGLVCAVGFGTLVVAQLYPWTTWLGGAIGGYGIPGVTRADNAPPPTLNLARTADATGNYYHDLVKFDRVIRPDGSAVLMRRVSDPKNPNVFGYLPESWPGVSTKGVERVHAADGRVVATRDVIIPQSEVMSRPIPMNGPRIGTLVVQRDVMADGSIQIAEAVTEPEPAVAVAPACCN